MEKRNTKYTVLLPTYNERDNIALIVWMLIRVFDKGYGQRVQEAIMDLLVY